MPLASRHLRLLAVVVLVALFVAAVLLFAVQYVHAIHMVGSAPLPLLQYGRG